LRNNLKNDYRKLSSTLNDIKVLSDNTLSGSKNIKSKLTLRSNYKGAGKLTPSMDVDLWDQTITQLVSNMDVQLKPLAKIVNDLKALQKSALRTKDSLTQEINLMQADLNRALNGVGASYKSHFMGQFN
jgi:hypothetical protein